MKNRKENGKGVGILLRTSRTALFVDGTTEGRYNENAKVWNVSLWSTKERTGIAHIVRRTGISTI